VDPKEKGIQPTEMGNPTEREDLQYLQRDHLHKVSKKVKPELAQR
jgi:hypothetical protein